MSLAVAEASDLLLVLFWQQRTSEVLHYQVTKIIQER